MSRRTDLRRSRIGRKRSKGTILVVILFVLAISAAVAALIYFYLPYFQEAKINPSTEIKMYHMGELVEQTGYQDEGTLYLPYNYVKEYVDSEIVHDDLSGYAIITTDSGAFDFTYPTRKVNNELFLAADPLTDFYELDIQYIEESSIFLVRDLTEPLLQGVALKTFKLREGPNLNLPSYGTVEIATKLTIMKEVDGWYWVETADGLIGYANKKQIEITGVELKEIEKSIYVAPDPLAKPIKLVWEYVNQHARTETSKIGDLEGVQVVSPTWFSLKENGLVANIADMTYVDWAHERGYQVWGLFSNSFEPALTNKMLTDPQLRDRVIKQMMIYVDLYELDGINIDFENLYLKDKDLFVQFVRELTSKLHEKNRTVSLDLTFHSKSENWSMFYDRVNLGKIVDYMIVMGYDQYPAGSTVAGPVAAIPWVEKGVENLLAEVPSNKIILGVPLYTRMWEETTNDNGTITAKSKTYSMDATNKWLEENKITPGYDRNTQLNYAELEKNNVKYRIWIEDMVSMKQRLELMEEYNLAGIAAWRRGFEDDKFWSRLAQ